MKDLSLHFKSEYEPDVFIGVFNTMLLSEDEVNFYLGFIDVEYELHSWVIETLFNEK